MSEHLYSDAREIYTYAITRSMPDNAVRLALDRIAFDAGRLLVIAVGKAAWQMASAAYQKLGSQITRGLVITKYGHSRGKIPRFWILEAGHPVPDANSFAAARAAMDLTEGLGKRDTVLFLLSVLAGCKRNNIISDRIISGFLPDLIRLRFILYDLKMLLGRILRRIHFEPAEQILKLQTLT